MSCPRLSCRAAMRRAPPCGRRSLQFGHGSAVVGSPRIFTTAYDAFRLHHAVLPQCPACAVVRAAQDQKPRFHVGCGNAGERGRYEAQMESLHTGCGVEGNGWSGGCGNLIRIASLALPASATTPAPAAFDEGPRWPHSAEPKPECPKKRKQDR